MIVVACRRRFGPPAIITRIGEASRSREFSVSAFLRRPRMMRRIDDRGKPGLFAKGMALWRHISAPGSGRGRTFLPPCAPAILPAASQLHHDRSQTGHHDQGLPACQFHAWLLISVLPDRRRLPRGRARSVYLGRRVERCPARQWRGRL